VASALKVASSDVHVVSYAVSAGGAYVTAEVDIHRFSSSSFASGSGSGSDILEVDGIDATVSSLESYLQGAGHREIWVGLLSSPQRSIFSQSSSVEFLSVEVVGSKDLILAEASHLSSVKEVVSYADVPGSNYHSPEAVSEWAQILNFVSLFGYAMAVGGVLVLVTGLVITARHRYSLTSAAAVDDDDPAPSTKTSSELEATEHSTSTAASLKRRERVDLKTLYSSAPTTAALKAFIASVSPFSSSTPLLSLPSLFFAHSPAWCRRTRFST
jgi:hypothetical protein